MNLIEDPVSAGGVTLGVRPEDVAVALDAGAAAEEARIQVVEPMGSEMLATIAWQGQRVVARCAADLPLAPEQRVWVRWPEEKTLRFGRDGRNLHRAAAADAPVRV
jgi:ABC-type sugar transport system ATPase subunit